MPSGPIDISERVQLEVDEDICCGQLPTTLRVKNFLECCSLAGMSSTRSETETNQIVQKEEMNTNRGFRPAGVCARVARATILQ